jgi:hypothetical protein
VDLKLDPRANKREVEHEIVDHDSVAGRPDSDAQRLRHRAGTVGVVLLSPVSMLPLIPPTQMSVMRCATEAMLTFAHHKARPGRTPRDKTRRAHRNHETATIEERLMRCARSELSAVLVGACLTATLVGCARGRDDLGPYGGVHRARCWIW